MTLSTAGQPGVGGRQGAEAGHDIVAGDPVGHHSVLSPRGDYRRHFNHD